MSEISGNLYISELFFPLVEIAINHRGLSLVNKLIGPYGHCHSIKSTR